MTKTLSVATLALLATFSATASYAMDEATKMTPQPVATSPVTDDIKAAPQPLKPVKAADATPKPVEASTQQDQEAK